jgi:prolyl oligopeptidase
MAAPVHRGDRLFYARRHATKEKSVVYFKPAAGGEEKVLFDPNTWSKDGSTSLGVWVPSWDGKRVAYGVKANNSDEAVLHVIDVDSLSDFKVDLIEGAKYADPSWTPDGSGFYYTWLPTDPKIPASERPGFAEVRFHRLGQDPKSDRVVHEKLGDATRFINAGLSKDGRWLLLSISNGWTSNDLLLRDLKTDDNAPWVPVAVGKTAHYGASVFHDRLYIQTDEGAPRGRIFVADAADPRREHWKEIVPQHTSDVLQSSSVVGGKLGVQYLHDVTSRLEVRDLDGKLVREQKLPGLGTASDWFGDEDQDDAYWTFTSFLVPTEIHRTSISTGETALYFRLAAPVDPSKYELEQLFFPSKDGTRIPVFVLHKKGLKKDGNSPLLLGGYGGFLVSEAPAFKAGAFAWLEQGGVYALANLRGGGEYGEEWHQAGMLLKKQNVFDDFIGAAEFLIKEGFTTRERLAIIGGSNGGLLVGAALTQRPDLFRAVICAVPLLDMVRYQKFGSGKTWTSEYGSIDDPAQFKALYAYSPYHQVKPGTRYPATVLASADSDDRVDPMHARKMAAALQNASTGGPVLLRIERHAGHGGADLIKAAIEQTADEYAFALEQLGR